MKIDQKIGHAGTGPIIWNQTTRLMLEMEKLSENNPVIVIAEGEGPKDIINPYPKCGIELTAVRKGHTIADLTAEIIYNPKPKKPNTGLKLGSYRYSKSGKK